jgi:hypothetical protein
MRKTKKGNWVMTHEERAERWAKCQYYIRRTETLSEAKKLAKRNGFAADTSVWVTALSKMLSM